MKMTSAQQAEEKLRDLYASYGYELFTVRHFEPYDLYARYKNFLTFKQVLTFTDTDGSLLALKPDVTLSVARALPGGEELRKVYYTENVYRVPENEKRFRQIRQAGLECIGPVGPYEIAEVTMLAQKSLSQIGDGFLLDVSHMGILKGILRETGVAQSVQEKILYAVTTRSLPRLQQLCEDGAISAQTFKVLSAMLNLYGPLGKVLEEAEKLSLPQESLQALSELKVLSENLRIAGTEQVNLDLSLWEDPEYYNGLILRGYLSGIPGTVLSGGRYDPLLFSLGKKGGAVGFAVYLDRLEDYSGRAEAPSVDVLILFEKDEEASEALRRAGELTKKGMTVRVQKKIPDELRAKTVMRVQDAASKEGERDV